MTFTVAENSTISIKLKHIWKRTTVPFIDICKWLTVPFNDIWNLLTVPFIAVSNTTYSAIFNIWNVAYCAVHWQLEHGLQYRSLTNESRP